MVGFGQNSSTAAAIAAASSSVDAGEIRISATNSDSSSGCPNRSRLDDHVVKCPVLGVRDRNRARKCEIARYGLQRHVAVLALHEFGPF
jgi:hypothetical protein